MPVITDSVYGNVQVDEPFLIALMESHPVQRLKGIWQAGARPFVSKEKPVTRYEHCVGTMLLLRKVGASVEEQAAGLLHDVGHSAFSHVMDIVFPQYNYNFDDAHLEERLQNSEVPKIVEKAGFDWKKIVDKESFSLLEQPSPKLCADRIDYTLREPMLDLHDVSFLVSHVTSKNGLFAFDSIESGRTFAYRYMRGDAEVWRNPIYEASYELLARAIRAGLSEGTLQQSDIFETDEIVLNKLNASNSEAVRTNIERLNPSLSAILDEQNPDFLYPAKVRVVDPFIAIPGTEPTPLSEIDPSFSAHLSVHRKNAPVKHSIRLVE